MKCLVLAGGKGNSLWPVSREEYPKQFMEIKQGHSLFQETVARNIPFCDEFLISTNARYHFIVEGQMHAFQRLRYRCFLEEEGRGTCLAIALVCMTLSPSELVYVVSSDQIIEGSEYKETILEGIRLARQGQLVTFGMQAIAPRTDYGYIRHDGERVLEFREKPDPETAARYLQEGGYLWNSGNCIFRAGDLLHELELLHPELYAAYRKLRRRLSTQGHIIRIPVLEINPEQEKSSGAGNSASATDGAGAADAASASDVTSAGECAAGTMRTVGAIDGAADAVRASDVTGAGDCAAGTMRTASAIDGATGVVSVADDAVSSAGVKGAADSIAGVSSSTGINEIMIPKISIEHAVLECSQHVSVVEAAFHWWDMGSLDMLRSYMKRMEDRNSILENSPGSTVINHAENRLVVVNGVPDITVINTDDACYITADTPLMANTSGLANSFDLTNASSITNTSDSAGISDPANASDPADASGPENASGPADAPGPENASGPANAFSPENTSGPTNTSVSASIKDIIRSHPEYRPWFEKSNLVYRPWGTYEVLIHSDHYKVKKVSVYPGRSLTRHRHSLRSEQWSVVEGTATVFLDDRRITLGVYDSIQIPVGAIHSLGNDTDEPLTIIEVSFGQQVKEEDQQDVQILPPALEMDELIMCEPAFKDYLWGGTLLRDRYHKKCDYEIIAESWELSAHEDGQCRVGSGRYQGMFFGEYLHLLPEEALGWKCHAFEKFPLLIKLIDARNSLSVQVHPNDEFALPVENEYGKNEMWYVLDCEPGACLYYGLRQDVSPEELRRRAEDHTITDVLNRVEVHPGDTFFIEAGTIHAIGAGILICEIQQNSNCTYRLYDYGRKDRYGHYRQLHLDKALQVVNCSSLTGRQDVYPTIQEDGFSHRLLCECKYFTSILYQVDSDSKAEITVDDTSFCAIMFLEGEGIIRGERQELTFHPADCCFITAGQKTITVDGPCQMILTRL